MILGLLGFITGILSVWTLTNLPGVEVGRAVYLAVASVLGFACLVFGYVSDKNTIDALGDIWQLVWKLSVGVLRVIRAIAR